VATGGLMDVFGPWLPWLFGVGAVLLGTQLGELLEGQLQTPRYVGRQHLARLGSSNLGRVDRPSRDEDERPGWRVDKPLP
jgi:hypothetical protein